MSSRPGPAPPSEPAVDRSTAEYDYHLPPELIAQHPRPRRDDARLLVVDRRHDTIEHARIGDLPQWLSAGDCVVLNDTRVLRARLIGRRSATGGRWQGLFLSEENGCWRLLGKTRGKLQPGEIIELIDRRGAANVQLHLLTRDDDGAWLARLDPPQPAFQVLEQVGRVPLPHYIRGSQEMPADDERYQTVFARHPGSIAAPTAGLHFTPELLARLDAAGISARYITLHVGLGTFRPLAGRTLAEHRMHTEWGQLDEATAAHLADCRRRGGRVVAVGTTVVRVLETAASNGQLSPFRGVTDLFIRPPYEFRAVDALLTNFHLPRSTLLVLVRTFGGDALIRRAYQQAIEQRYRFYSYGDAMLIL